MPLFVCDKCGCIENTACGHWWARKHVFFEEGSLDPELVGKPLCSECIPARYSDGSPAGTGEWHGRFPKEHWTSEFKVKPEGTF